MGLPSKYSNNKTVSEAQYITELICEHKATIEKRDLHFKFWLNKQWAKFFRDQIATANKLLKKYSGKAIIKALNSPKASRIYSLRAPHLIGIIEEFEEQIAADANKESCNLPIDRTDKENYKSRSSSSGKNIISKLKELENES